jgi:peptidylamidoglycolate lyase
MIKRSLLCFFGLSALLILAYFFQPIKKGRGSDSRIRYELVDNWLHLPNEVKLGNPTGISIDTSQNIVVFHRAGRKWPLFGSMPNDPIQQKTIFVIGKNNGELIKSWGDSLFIMPHGLKVDPDNNIWVTDVGYHQIFKFSYWRIKALEPFVMWRLTKPGQPVLQLTTLHFYL